MSEKLNMWLEVYDLTTEYGAPEDGYYAVARRFDADHYRGVRYRIDYYKDGMPAHSSSGEFGSTRELEEAMRAVEPDLRKWRIWRGEVA